MPAESYDVIIIGTGAGGGTLAQRLAPSGKRILILERGGFLPREKQNWDSTAVFQDMRYHTSEQWYDAEGKSFRPHTGYFVGGNTKVYGGAMFRLRERDFETVQHRGGVSPEWPVKYRDFEPYYRQAELLYDVHGQRGVDPTEPPMSADYPFPPFAHEPRIQELHDRLQKHGHVPFPVPLALKRDDRDPLHSPCIRCSTCDGFPCLIDAKADADLNGIRPALRHPDVTLELNAKVTRLRADRSAREVSAVEADVNGVAHRFYGDLVVVAAGAINSAALLLRSASDKHPHGLANSSDQVGRNYMRHLNGAMLGLSRRRNPVVFQKTLALNDYYWGEADFPFPMGHIQLLGKTDRGLLAADAPWFAPGFALDQMARHSVDWWVTAEDLPHPGNRVMVGRDGAIHLQQRDRYYEHFDRLVARWKRELRAVDAASRRHPLSLYLFKKIPAMGVAHQNGTCRFGDDPRTSVLNAFCQTHDVDNLYVVDGSFFCSSGAVNPSLTIAANALRVGDHLLERLGH
ncbi:MAG: GMC family oxidoreductase [Gemmatimonadota bacterium]|nr:GMC family oxidoreductase [Gemmatimonadota bacterium]